MKETLIKTAGWGYRHIGAPLFFKFDSEPIHDFVLNAGEMMGKIPGVRGALASVFETHYKNLATEVAGIRFGNPIGLAAGFDHEAQLTRIIGGLGFGFESVGTITNGAYGGNSYPRLKRLVKSKALLVNKGFKSSGIDAVLARLAGSRFDTPIGISIGRTNTNAHETHEDAIRDIAEAFEKGKRSNLPFSYFELNISCPNLLKDISFYTPERLDQLLSALDVPALGRPLFLKMPITLENERVIALLDTAIEHGVAAVIFGNLQHDRSHKAFDRNEIAAYEGVKGNWSGMPCQDRSDELVRAAYTHVHKRMAIVGCGGIFTAEDAYRKIRNGASLLQLAAATVFEGPQVAAEISIGLSKLLERDGFASVTQAVGSDVIV